jgi:hypothetical protein
MAFSIGVKIAKLPSLHRVGATSGKKIIRLTDAQLPCKDLSAAWPPLQRLCGKARD